MTCGSQNTEHDYRQSQARISSFTLLPVRGCTIGRNLISVFLPIFFLLGFSQVGAQPAEHHPDGPPPAEFALLEALDRDEAELNRLFLELERLERKIPEVQQAVETTRSRLRELEQRRAPLLKNARAAIDRLYRRSRSQMGEWIAGGPSRRNRHRLQSHLRWLARNDLASFQQWRAFNQQLSEQSQLLNLQLQKLEALQKRSRQSHEALERKRRRMQARLEAIHSDPRLAQRWERMYAQAQGDLDKLFAEPSRTRARRTAVPFSKLRDALVCPVPGRITVGYGESVGDSPADSLVQKGWRIEAEGGSLVRVLAAGEVSYAGPFRGFGNLIIVDHGGGHHTLYAHLSLIKVERGRELGAREIIGRIGQAASTSMAGLHFELREEGRAIDPTGWVRCP